MFRKLRNKFVFINLLTTTIILLAAYSTIYLFAKNSADSRRPFPAETRFESFESADSESDATFRRFVEERIVDDRELALKNLLKILLITGFAVEVIVAIFSYFFAEEAIKPVKDAYHSQKIFIANASHEIKTPIAAIKANLEAADLSSTNHWIKNIEVEADKAEHLTLDLLELARTDLAAPAAEKQPVVLKSLVQASLAAFAPRFTQRKLKLTAAYQLPAKSSAQLCEADFKELLEILLDNACKYARSKVRLELSPKSLVLQNDGAKLTPDELSHLFDRFYQVDKSASGSGLGLAIAKSLAERNGWQLSASVEKSTISFTLVFA